MQRRRFLAAGGAAGVAATAGCVGIFGDYRRDVPEPVDDPPDGVYKPTYVAGRTQIGADGAGRFSVAVFFTLPRRYWTVEGDGVSMVQPAGSAKIHLLFVLVESGSGRVVPTTTAGETTVKLEATAASAGDLRPMISQHLGHHHGANLPMPSKGSYTVEATFEGTDVNLLGSYADADALANGFEISVPFEWRPESLEDVPYREIDDAGTPGAVSLVDDDQPVSRARPPSELPGTVLGTPTVDDATLATVLVPRDGGEYLAVSPRCQYTAVPLAGGALEATLPSGETVSLTESLGAGLGRHYGAEISTLESGDEVTVTVTAPPSTARHEGYEHAFRQFDPAIVTVP